MEVIHAVITPIRATILFLNTMVKSTRGPTYVRGYLERLATPCVETEVEVYHLLISRVLFPPETKIS